MESFETGLPTSYITETSYTLESGIWSGQINGVIRGTSGVNTGTYSCQLRSQTGAQITTPTLNGGVGIISFYVTASTASGGLQVKISTDDGLNLTQVEGSPISFGIEKEFRSFNVFYADVNKIQFYRTGATVYIDDISITSEIVSEPSNHISDFSAIANSATQITVTWDDATAAAGEQLPSAYLVKASIAPGAPTAPVDGTPESDAVLVKNILYGTKEAIFTGLNPDTEYSFTIWPYTNSGSVIDYKTDGTIPSISATTKRMPVTIFSENMGSPSGNTAIGSHTFQNASPVKFTGTADVRNNGLITGYDGASGGGNIFITNTIGRFFQIEGINTLGFANIKLSLGHFKSTTAGNNELKIEVSEDGVSWNELTYSRDTGSGTSIWILIQPTGTIPSTQNLRLRFTQTSATPSFVLMILY